MVVAGVSLPVEAGVVAKGEDVGLVSDSGVPPRGDVRPNWGVAVAEPNEVVPRGDVCPNVGPNDV